MRHYLRFAFWCVVYSPVLVPLYTLAGIQKASEFTAEWASKFIWKHRLNKPLSRAWYALEKYRRMRG
jgi:hypothetical protein